MKQLTRVLALVLALGILTLAVSAGAEGAETYAASPILASQVEAGALPPVAERLPLEPKLVHEVLDSDLDYEIGNYGGTLISGTTAVNWNSDVFVGRPTTEPAEPADGRSPALRFLDSLSLEERMGYWKGQMERCISCHACRYCRLATYHSSTQGR